MKKNVNSINKPLNKVKNYSSTKKRLSSTSKEKINSSKEKKDSKNNLIFNKKKLDKKVIPVSNSKCCIIKLSNISKTKKEYNKKFKSNSNSTHKKILSDSKNQSLNVIKKNKKNPVRLYSNGKTSPEKNITFIKNKKELNLLYNNKSFKSQRFLQNNYSIKAKKISFFKDKLNTCKIDNNMVLKGKQKPKEKMPIYHKKIDKKHKLILINKMKNNIINISSDNAKRSINYYNQRKNNVLNNSQIITNKKENIYLNNKEKRIRNIFYPRSPNDKLISPKNIINPIKKVILIRNRKNDINLNESQIEKSRASTTFTLLNSDNKLPDNYGFHEIIHKNSPKKVVQNKNINDEENNYYLKETQKNIYIRNNRPLLEELTSQNDNFNKISTTILINNQSFNNLDNKFFIPYYSTLNSNKNLSLKSSFREGNYNAYENTYVCYNDNFRNLRNNSNLFFSPKPKKLDISGQLNEIETEKEDVQTIHYFGEEMLKKNENYNFDTGKEIYKFSTKGLKNSELKRNNSLNDINDRQKNWQKKSFKSIPFSHSYNEFKWRKYNKRNESKIEDLPINKNNKRFNHNIISRKKKNRLVMEKSLNEQFISKNNKIKSSENTRDKISFCESSINLDNDSINEIIKEFEKEMELEEKKDKLIKDSSQKKLIINNSENVEGFFYSFVSDNDNFSINMSKGSTNDSKVKKKKVRYYKTKNFELEKNYDFFISPTKIRNEKNTIL